MLNLMRHAREVLDGADAPLRRRGRARGATDRRAARPMREESARLWRQALAPCQRIHIYTVDPGAHAVATELVPLIRAMERLRLVRRGWRPQEPGRLRNRRRSGSAGRYAAHGIADEFRAHARRAGAAAAGGNDDLRVRSLEEFRRAFGGGPLPDMIVVPDELARRNCSPRSARTASRVRMLPHLALEAAAERFARQHRHAGDDRPAARSDGGRRRLGYDWRSTLEAAALATRPRGTHSRQTAPAAGSRRGCQRIAAWRQRASRGTLPGQDR